MKPRSKRTVLVVGVRKTSLSVPIRPRRTVRQQGERPNGEKTAQQSHDESASLRPHARSAGGGGENSYRLRRGYRHTSGVPESPNVSPPPPDGRHSTAMAGTETTNGETAQQCAPRRVPLTAWELPQLIRPQPLRSRRRERAKAIQPFYVRLVSFFYSQRYATAAMALRFFPDLLKTERTTQRHLTNMVAHGLIAVASSRGTSPNFPFVYFATRKGIRFVSEQIPNGDKVEIPATEERRSRGQSLHSLLHELHVTEFSVMLANTARSRGDLQLLMQERRYFRRGRRLSYRDGETHNWIEPDFGFLPAIGHESESPRVLPMHFVEMELGTHSVSQIRDKLVAYDRWAVQEGREYLQNLYGRHTEQNANGTFRLLLIAADPYGRVGDIRRLLDLLVQAIELPRLMRDRIWLTTAGDLKAHVHDEAPLSAPIWLRAKDAKCWLPEYRDSMHKELTSNGRRMQHYARRRTFFADKIPSQHRHPLFSPATD